MIGLVHQHQPMACTFDPLGADIRWGGNEDGIAGDPSWPTMPNAPYTQENGNSGVRGGAVVACRNQYVDPPGLVLPRR